MTGFPDTSGIVTKLSVIFFIFKNAFNKILIIYIRSICVMLAYLTFLKM